MGLRGTVSLASHCTTAKACANLNLNIGGPPGSESADSEHKIEPGCHDSAGSLMFGRNFSAAPDRPTPRHLGRRAELLAFDVSTRSPATSDNHALRYDVYFSVAFSLLEPTWHSCEDVHDVS